MQVQNKVCQKLRESSPQIQVKYVHSHNIQNNEM